MKLGGGKENRESERSFARKTSTAQMLPKQSGATVFPSSLSNKFVLAAGCT